MMNKSHKLLLIILGIFILFDGCISIHPIKSVKFLELQKKDVNFWHYKAEKAGIDVYIRPVLTQCDNFLFFDADFSSLGIVPVFIKIINKNRLFISWRSKDFILESPYWKWKPLKFKNIRKRLFKKYEVTTYSKKSYETFMKSFDSLILHDGYLKQGEEKNGVLFFNASFFASSKLGGRSILKIRNLMIEGTKTTVVFPLK